MTSGASSACADLFCLERESFRPETMTRPFGTFRQLTVRQQEAVRLAGLRRTALTSPNYLVLVRSGMTTSSTMLMITGSGTGEPWKRKW